MHELVTVRDGTPTTTSRIIAETFSKRHDNVVRDIQKIIRDIDVDFGLLNFEDTSYIDSWNREQTEYILTKDGFILLVMGYTGSKAMQYKIAYINAFNKMEAALKLPADPIEARITALERCIDMLIGKITAAHPQITEAPLMLPMVQCVSKLKEECPGTKLSVSTIKGLVAYEQIPFVRSGSRTYINYNKLVEYLNGLKMPISEAVIKLRAGN